MKRTKALLIAVVVVILLSACGAKKSQVSEEYHELLFRFADAEEGATFLKENTEYLNSLTHNDLCFRLQKTDATLEEYVIFAQQQVMDFTQEEKEAISREMQRIGEICVENQYTLPNIGEITFVKTTMEEESGVMSYTHGTSIFVGDSLLSYLCREEKWAQDIGMSILVHELFHCLTRNDDSFREAMYEILGFQIQEEEFVFSEEIRERIISNPDVGKHNAYATFRIEGQDRDCIVVFATIRPFEKKGDSIFNLQMTGLIPIDDLSVMYPSVKADNFWEVFGLNTQYDIDPEEALADNFADAIMYGVDGKEYKSPEIIEAICDYLKK